MSSTEISSVCKISRRNIRYCHKNLNLNYKISLENQQIKDTDFKINFSNMSVTNFIFGSIPVDAISDNNFFNPWSIHKDKFVNCFEKFMF